MPSFTFSHQHSSRSRSRVGCHRRRDVHRWKSLVAVASFSAGCRCWRSASAVRHASSVPPCRRHQLRCSDAVLVCPAIARRAASILEIVRSRRRSRFLYLIATVPAPSSQLPASRFRLPAERATCVVLFDPRPAVGGLRSLSLTSFSSPGASARGGRRVWPRATGCTPRRGAARPATVPRPVEAPRRLRARAR